MANGDSNTSSIGAAWIFLNTDKTVCYFKNYLGTTNWPSSTKLELLAIWLALLMVPLGKKILIYSDSAATITGIKKGLKVNNIKQWYKFKTMELLANIVDIIRTKELRDSLVKAKANAGDQ